MKHEERVKFYSIRVWDLMGEAMNLLSQVMENQVDPHQDDWDDALEMAGNDIQDAVNALERAVNTLANP